MEIRECSLYENKQTGVFRVMIDEKHANVIMAGNGQRMENQSCDFIMYIIRRRKRQSLMHKLKREFLREGKNCSRSNCQGQGKYVFKL